MDRTDIKSLNLEELKTRIAQLGDKPFRAKQIYEWMHRKLIAEFDEMTNIPKSLRERLEEETYLTALEPVDVRVSRLDGTRKTCLPSGTET